MSMEEFSLETFVDYIRSQIYERTDLLSRRKGLQCLNSIQDDNYIQRLSCLFGQSMVKIFFTITLVCFFPFDQSQILP